MHFLKKQHFVWILTIILLLLIVIIIKKNHSNQKQYFSEEYIIPEYFSGPSVVNPYLGFVNKYPDNPDSNKFGFLGIDPVFEKNEDNFVVGIFGGSLAAQYYLDQKDILIEKLSFLLSLKNKKIRIVSVALGGFKQPQQLMALNYFLVLGSHFDVVINIDGFNEIALPYIENVPNGISSFFPRQWNLYSRSLFDQKSLTLLTNIQKDKNYLTKLENIFSDGILKRLGFLYKYLYMKQQIKISNKQKELNDYINALPKDYQVTGPEKLIYTHDEIHNNIVNVWKESSIQMANLSKENKILYLHFLQPNQYFSGSKNLNDNEKRIAYSIDSLYKKPVEIFYPKLIEKGQELINSGVNFIDLTYLFKNLTDTIYIDNCCHINSLGNSLITNQILEKITENQ